MGSRDPVNAIVEGNARQAQARPAARYSWQAIALHWVLAVLIIGMLVLGYSLEDIPRNTPARGFYVNLHKSFGVLALVLVLVRLGWRFSHKPPPLEASMPRWQVVAAAWSHRLLYLCILCSRCRATWVSFGKYGVKFFGIELPNWGWEDKALRGFFGEVHDAVAIRAGRAGCSMCSRR